MTDMTGRTRLIANKERDELMILRGACPPQYKYYPVVISENESEVGYGRWGANASQNAREDLNEMLRRHRRDNQFIYDYFIVIARYRSEVVDNYEL